MQARQLQYFPSVLSQHPPTTPLPSQLPTSFVLHPLPHPEASGPVENSQENVLHTYHDSPQAPGAAPQFSCWGGLGLVTSKAVSPPELGDSMYREGFWGHRPRAFIFKIYINRHTYSFLKEHGNKKKKSSSNTIQPFSLRKPHSSHRLEFCYLGNGF